MTTPEPPTEPQQQCYELMAHCKATAAELTQARFENEALQRRLAEYASEVQRLQELLAAETKERHRLQSSGNHGGCL
jgi:regulator of replication initiation timing